VSGAALPFRLVDVPDDFTGVEPRVLVLDPPAAGVLPLGPDDFLPETLSLGPAVTAGIVDEDAAVVSAADCAEGRHATITPATSIIETFVIGVITCSWSEVHEAGVGAPAVPIHQA
jgi:hypothetical protein